MRTPSDKVNLFKTWALPLVLVLFGLILYGGDFLNQDAFYYDSDGITMDGIYLLDFLKELPITNIYGYTTRYYAQYPSLTIGVREPFFPLIEAIFYSIFGINISTAKLAVLAFAALGIFFFYRLSLLLYGSKISTFATLLFITTPFVFRFAKVPMLEIPAMTMTLVSIYYFYKYIEFEDKKSLFLFFPVFALTLWTKRITGFLVIFFIIYPILRKKWRLLVKKEAIIGYLFLFITVIPLIVITLWLGGMNIDQSIGRSNPELAVKIFGLHSASRISFENLSYYLKIIYNENLALPVIILSLAGLFLAIVKKDKRIVLPLLWIGAVYFTSTYFIAKTNRYTIYLIPPFCLLAATLLESMVFPKKQLKYLILFLLSGTIIFQVFLIQHIKPFRASGFREAAKYVTDNPKGYTIFLGTVNRGSFIFWVRKFDKDRRFIVLRGDKLLTSSAAFHKYKLKVYVNSAEQIYEIFKKYGSTYIVVLSKDTSEIPIFSVLLELLKTDKFKLVKEIPIDSDFGFLKGQKILIYERLEPAYLPKGELILPLPIVDKTIRIPVEELVKNRKSI